MKNCLLHIRGNNCTIEIVNHCILSNVELWIEDNECTISIGDRTTIEGAHIAATEGKSISIGEDCMFSHGIEIRNGDSHTIFDTSSRQRINSAQAVKIGNHVWLSADSKILKGSIIGDGTVIGAGTIVTNNAVDQNSIYTGIPARKVKENIFWDRNR